MTTSARVELKYVHNLGNFESIHIGLAIEDSARANESHKELLDRVYEFVEKELLLKAKEVIEELSSPGTK